MAETKIHNRTEGHSRYSLWDILPVISKNLFLETNADATRNKFPVDLLAKKTNGGRDADNCLTCLALIH